MCDGVHWNVTNQAEITCVVSNQQNPKRSCQFKNDGYCGWSQLQTDDSDWTISKLPALHFDASGLTWNSTAAIFSPGRHLQTTYSGIRRRFLLMSF